MGIMQALRSLVTPRYQVVVNGGTSPIVAGMDVVQLYRTQPNLRAVVSYLSDNAASVPWKVYDRVADGDRVRVTDSPAALLLARPSPDLTAYEFRRRIFSDLYLADRHLSIVRPDATTPSGWSVWPVPFAWLDGYVGGTVYRPDAFVISTPSNGRVEVPSDICLWLHGYDPTNPMGQTSPVESLRDLLMEQVESATFRRQMWSRGGRFNAYVTRPKDVEPWDDEAFERFRRTWNESWAGRDGSQAGAMPILEDGMEIKQVQFNARDAEWSEAKRLGREDVAGVYHLNPALIWPGSGQTYASAKENARALYNDTLAPKLMEVTDKINAQLLPMVGEDARHYVEYDLSVKLQGSFEERTAVLQSAVGGPFMTRDEARGMLNLPHIDGADQLIVPLNVTEGGLASPRDTDPTIDRNATAPALKEAPHGHACQCAACKSSGVHFKAAATDEDGRELADVLASFYRRQRKSVLPKIGADPSIPDEGDPAWWDSDRWNRELTDDLNEVAVKQSEAAALRALEAMGEDASGYSVDQTRAFINAMSWKRACMVNAATLRDLVEVVEDDEGERTPADVFDVAESKRAENSGYAYASALAGWSALEAVRQCAPRRGATKTWDVTSGNPRPSHAAMDGETVPYDERFSNGAMWPGDADALSAEEVANCQCAVTIDIP